MYKFLIALIITGSLFATFSTHAANEPSYRHALVATALHHNDPITQPLTIIDDQKTKNIKMTVFTGYNGYKTTDKQLGATIWATVEPDLKQRCTQFYKQRRNKITHKELALWLAQMLGLPSDNAENRRFVILEVPVIQAYYGSSANTIGIFRPCTDPRIGPHLDNSSICPQQMNVQDSNIASEFKTWFINYSITTYSVNGMPWTGYGYTYNWNPLVRDHAGVSEFVVLKNTPVMVVPNPVDMASAYITPEQYCS